MLGSVRRLRIVTLLSYILLLPSVSGLIWSIVNDPAPTHPSLLMLLLLSLVLVSGAPFFYADMMAIGIANRRGQKEWAKDLLLLAIVALPLYAILNPGATEPAIPLYTIPNPGATEPAIPKSVGLAEIWLLRILTLVFFCLWTIGFSLGGSTNTNFVLLAGIPGLAVWFWSASIPLRRRQLIWLYSCIVFNYGAIIPYLILNPKRPSSKYDLS